MFPGSSATSPKCLLIGGGITASLVSYLLRKVYPSMNIMIWEKSETVGGRMMTIDAQYLQCRADVGTQYITAGKESLDSHSGFYSELINAKIIQPLKGIIEGNRKRGNAINYVAPNGMKSIVEHFFRISEAEVRHSHCVELVQPIRSYWKVTCKTGTTNTFDIVIFTTPLPEVHKIYPKIEQILPSHAEYSSRYALTLFYKDKQINELFEWCGKYVFDNSCIRYISIDTKKRNQEESGTSIVVHCSVGFSNEYKTANPTEVQSLVLTNLIRILPTLPPADDSNLLYWEWSQVTQACKGTSGAYLLNKDPFLVVGGDAFTNSKFDGCIDSALAVSTIIKNGFKCCL